VLDAVPRGDSEVDRLAAELAQGVERRRRELDDVAFQQVALGRPENRRTGSQPAALALLLDEPLALERAQQS
jgi:hypothetical protein